MHMHLSRNLDEDSAITIANAGEALSGVRATARAQVQQAEQAVADRIAAARATQPEYTLVSVATELGTEIGIYTRAQGVETDWFFVRRHLGADADLLAEALTQQGAPVTICRNVHHLNRGGCWQPTTRGFRPSCESERLAAEISALFRKADALDDEWRTNERWGESGSRSLRKNAEYKIARLKTLDPSYPVHTLRTQQATASSADSR